MSTALISQFEGVFGLSTLSKTSSQFVLCLRDLELRMSARSGLCYNLQKTVVNAIDQRPNRAFRFVSHELWIQALKDRNILTG